MLYFWGKIVFKPVSDINTVFLHDYTDFFDPALGSLDENKLGDEILKHFQIEKVCYNISQSVTFAKNYFKRNGGLF